MDPATLTLIATAAAPLIRSVFESIAQARAKGIVTDEEYEKLLGLFGESYEQRKARIAAEASVR